MMRRSSCSCFSQAGVMSLSLHLKELESISTQGEYPDDSCCHTDDISSKLREHQRQAKW